ncbi:hypothetical protein AB0F73_22230 [Micromonospora purpureochromogenes]
MAGSCQAGGCGDSVVRHTAVVAATWCLVEHAAGGVADRDGTG